MYPDERPSRSACAVVIFKNGKEIIRFVRGLGSRTSNEAEYEALIAALLCCWMSELPSPDIYCDSTVVVQHTTNKWVCKSPLLLPYYLTVQDIQAAYGFKIHQVPRAKVYMPDELCNAFLDRQEQEERRILGDPSVGSS